MGQRRRLYGAGGEIRRATETLWAGRQDERWRATSTPWNTWTCSGTPPLKHENVAFRFGAGERSALPHWWQTIQTGRPRSGRFCSVAGSVLLLKSLITFSSFFFFFFLLVWDPALLSVWESCHLIKQEPVFISFLSPQLALIVAQRRDKAHNLSGILLTALDEGLKKIYVAARRKKGNVSSEEAPSSKGILL